MEYRDNLYKTSDLNKKLTSVPRGVSQPLKVLIVDDDNKVNNLLVQFLKMQGCEVYSVEDSVSALKLTEKHQFDVIFTDWDMADISGSELARAIRQRDQRVMIFVITGWSPETLAQNGSTKLFDQFIKKPFRLDTITNALDLAKKKLALKTPNIT